MDLRTVLLAGTLALAGTTLRAEELQWTISGSAFCNPFANGCTSQATTGAATITFDLNTLSATLTPTFAHNVPGGPPGDILVNLDVSFPLTNYSAIVGGHTIGFAAHGSGLFGCGEPFIGTSYECGGGFSPAKGPGAFDFTDNETWVQTLTETQYKALQDPLAFILLSDTGPPGVGCAFAQLCFIDEGAGGRVQFGSTFTVTRVPTPGPLPLFLAGLVALAFSMRGYWLFAKR